MNQTDIPLTHRSPMPTPGGRFSFVIALGALLLALALVPWTGLTAPILNKALTKLPFDPWPALTQVPSAVALISIWIVIWQLDPRRRAAIIYFIVALGVTSASNESLKRVAARTRPEALVLPRGKAPEKYTEMLKQYSLTMTPADKPTADRWFVSTWKRPWFSDLISSFPSGHSATSAVLAACLCALYPPCRWLWLLLMVGVGLSRVEAQRHFIEDVLFGWGLGWLVTGWVFGWKWPGRFAEKLGLSTAQLLAPSPQGN